jgi:hypothetical protein
MMRWVEDKMAVPPRAILRKHFDPVMAAILNLPGRSMTVMMRKSSVTVEVDGARGQSLVDRR